MARKRLARGSAIDFARVERMFYKRFLELRICSEVEVVLENGVLELHRGWEPGPESTVPMTPEVAERLTQLFGDCGISSWKRHYKPEGYMVKDGEGWDLALELDDGSVFKSEGSNAWPENFEKLEEGLVGLFG